MSKTESTPSDQSADQSREQWIRDHREELEREANSDAPHAWVAERFLQSLEEDGS